MKKFCISKMNVLKVSIWRQLIWILLVLSILAIYPTYWYGRINAGGLPWGGSRPFYQLWSLIVAPFFFISFFNIFVIKKIRILHPDPLVKNLFKWTCFFPLLVIYGFLLGIYQKNSINFLLGDTYKYLLFPLGFWLIYLANLDFKDAERLLVILAVCSVIPPGLGVGSNLFLFSYLLVKKGFFPSRIPTWLLALVFLYSFLIGKTTLILVPLLSFISFRICPYLGRKFLVKITFFIIFILAIISSAFPYLITKTGAYKKTKYFLEHFTVATTLDYRGLDLSTYQRIQEVYLVMEKFKSYSCFYIITGFGNGATFPAWGLPEGYQELIDARFEGRAHHIHINPIFIFHQWGIIGLLFISYFVFSLFFLCFRLRKYKILVMFERNSFFYHCFFVGSASLLMLISLVGYGIFNPPKISLLYAGMLLGLCCYSLSYCKYVLKSNA